MDFETFLNKEMQKDYFKSLTTFVDEEYNKYVCYPLKENIYNALKLTPLDKVKVVILGQDPYHEPNQAHGLAFSVLCDKLPPSLKNIYKEMSSDLGALVKQDGNLEYLARQGVLLLNTTLTVREGQALSHYGKGWETLTDNIIKELNDSNNPIVFILWGNNARSKKKLLTNTNHYIIESAHPSPLSAYHGFFGSKPFSKTNEFLKNNNIEEIKWIK